MSILKSIRKILSKIKNKRKNIKIKEIYNREFSFEKDTKFKTTDSGEFVDSKKCVLNENIECRMETSPIIKAAEIQENVKKIQTLQKDKNLIPCYCNININIDNITSDMCEVCVYRLNCKTIRK